MAEGRMNLAALQQRDPYITDIEDTASQVALYSFSAKSNEWEKTSIEGSLFVYTRSASPLHGFMILNRLGLHNLIEPITKDVEFQQQDPFLLYRNGKAIYGIWFYEKERCSRLGQLMSRYVAETVERQKTTSDSPQIQRSISLGGSSAGTMPAKQKLGTGPQSQVDIIQMLSKAQQEYNTTKGGGGQEEVTRGRGRINQANKKSTEPKPMIDNPNASATKNTNLIRPMPLKLPDADSPVTAAGKEDGKLKEGVGLSTTPGTAPISLDALFRTASLQQKGGTSAQIFPRTETNTVTTAPTIQRSVSMTTPLTDQQREPVFPRADLNRNSEADGNIPELLKHIMSTGSMVEDIERQHIQLDNPPPSLPPTVPPPSPNIPPHSQGFTLGPADSAVFKVPDLSVPPPIHPAFRGTSPMDTINQGKTSPRAYSTAAKVVSGNMSSQKVSPSSHNTGLSSKSGRSDQLGPTPRGDADSVATDKRTTGPSPVLLKMGQCLLTPADLLGQQTTADKPQNAALSAAASSLSADVLLSPMAFATSYRVTPPVSTTPATQTKSDEEDQLALAALTKQQMQQAMLYLIKNDPNFISTLHEAYLKSLQEFAGQKT